MINVLNIVFEIKTNDSMQKLVNEISEEYYNDIEYIQCNRSKKILYVVFRDNKINKKITQLNNFSTISNVETDITLLGLIIKNIFGESKLRLLNPKVEVE